MNSYSEGAQGRGLYMWLLFVRNGAFGGGKEEERGGSEVCSGDAVTPAFVFICVSVLMHVCLRRRKSVYLVCGQVSVRSYVGVQGQGKGDGAKGEGHNALGEGDQIFGVRW